MSLLSAISSLTADDELAFLFSRKTSSMPMPTLANGPELRAYISLQLIGLIGCLVIFVTGFFSESALRHTAWFSFMFSWVLSTLSYLLLFISGRLENAPFGLCLIQSALMYAAPTLTAATTLAFVTQIFFKLHNSLGPRERGGRLIWLMLVGPYVLHATIATETIIIGLEDDNTLYQSGMGGYCYLKNAVPSQTSTVTVMVLMIPTVVLGAWTCVLLTRNWSSKKLVNYPVSTTIRVLVFSALSMIANTITIMYMSAKGRSHRPYVVVSLIPIAAILAFGTQKDIIS
ncbi:hypothetical protein HYPSUDRAFT_1022158 [Hypholoma sublateritium FD-334 SS-4]|uniref:G-protein coupled receptors family 2 profile 2 domain-containing protein n=1 Tax=Hypholoma sublateritium (strain FD-334 SS-4) TaxID=945553 RepID=A0A0D2NED3_HYPSF|nr:hypothetical protein HYPSUDRAFT_1022158 [Hypholoma sublateritium FD-334 SS-4]